MYMGIKLITQITLPDFGYVIISSVPHHIGFPCVTINIAKIANKKIKDVLTIAVGETLHIPGDPFEVTKDCHSCKYNLQILHLHDHNEKFRWVFDKIQMWQ